MFLWVLRFRSTLWMIYRLFLCFMGASRGFPLRNWLPCTGRDAACLLDLAITAQGAVSTPSIIRPWGALLVSGVRDAWSHLETCRRAAFGSAITHQILQVQRTRSSSFSSFHPVTACRNNSMIDVSSHSFRRGDPHLHTCPQTVPCNIRAANLLDCRRVSQVPSTSFPPLICTSVSDRIPLLPVL